MSQSERREPSIPLPGSSAAGDPAGSQTTQQAAGRQPGMEAFAPRGQADSERGPGRRPNGGGSAGGGARGGSLVVALAALLIGLIIGGGGVALLRSDGGESDPFAGNIDASRYQAVILTNDKVYFGRISKASDEFYRLDSAFFLRETRDSADAEPVRSLLPVNREIHAPENRMLIRRDEVVLVENLEKDSPILTEITRQLGDK